MGWKSIVALIVIGTYSAWALRPTYEIKVYKLGFYPYVYLTQMIYWRPINRQLLYIYGKHEEESYPEKDYVVMDHFSGFDASSNIIASCDSNQNIVINYINQVFEAPAISKKIRPRRMTDYSEWVRLDTNQVGLRIKAY